MKTIMVKPAEVSRKWFLLDAEGKSLGRVAAKAASIVRGKEKAVFVPHQEVGDYVVIVNAEKAVVTGAKRDEKLYHHHTGFPGGLKTVTYAKLLERHPTAPMEKAVNGMLPKGVLGRQLFRNVKVYAGPAHPHEAQQPETINL
ncbi:MAG: 50S ribosomal protein L13 [Spirochaetaceae bacterium]|jgi:large subunit ribosomal protein L13|nr:50S ribosomal protein L13 [Spirochaetaceae bacterium]